MWFPKVFMLSILFSLFQSPASGIKKSYIVYFGSHAHGPQISKVDLDAVADSHQQFLGSYLGSGEKARDAIIYSYDRHINGFAAMLEEEEAAKIARHPNVVSVFLNQGRKLHTTHSWDFMLMEKDGVVDPSSLWRRARFGEDSIIANLDTGVWPESRSFSEEGIGPLPSKWKGTCENDTAVGVTCNRKLIGARYFNKGYIAYAGGLTSSDDSARDIDGHGTHTLSTAGGNFVPGANVFGLGNGTAKGGSPKARVASYKVCWPPVNGSECFDADIMKAFDMAIHDGVDVLSVSLGGEPSDYFNDGLAIGALHAVKNGITVVCSAGNSGPMDGTVTNTAPWIITVGASTVDREFETFVELRNGKRLQVHIDPFTDDPLLFLIFCSLICSLLVFFILHMEAGHKSFKLSEKKFYPLITGKQAKAANASEADALLCKPKSLDHEKAKGKVVVCLRGETARMDKGYQAALVGAAGMILCNDKAGGSEIIADPHVLPAAQISYTDGLAVFAYINSTDHALGYISSPTAKLGTKPAPFMAAFSSRGPNTVTSEILKPDITAPGVNIIAAFSEAISPTDFDFDKRKSPFITESGTSMSCPHVAGVVGLLKTLHPDWSPAAIRSAIMTTARTRANTMTPMVDGRDGLEATPFSYGAGHIRPNRAQDPGLVFDLSINDYLDFLCASGYNSTMIEPFSDGPYKCPESTSIVDFNNPSITIRQLRNSMSVIRKVKNVGLPGTYAAHVREPYGISVSVEPNILTFEKEGDEKSFKVTFEARWDGVTEDYEFGSLTWTDGRHYVRSPIVVSFGGDY